MKLVLAMMATATVAPAAMAQTMTPTDYVAAAGASDTYEKESSQMVLGTTKNAKIRQFAQMMIRDHNKSTADVKAAAAKSNVRPAPPRLNAEQASMIAQLKAAKGDARDSTYLTQQKMAHEKALALHQSYAASGTAPALKTVAAATAPVVQHHIEMLQGM
jgi:putative membrane protein